MVEDYQEMLWKPKHKNESRDVEKKYAPNKTIKPKELKYGYCTQLWKVNLTWV